MFSSVKWRVIRRSKKEKIISKLYNSEHLSQITRNRIWHLMTLFICFVNTIFNIQNDSTKIADMKEFFLLHSYQQIHYHQHVKWADWSESDTLLFSILFDVMCLFLGRIWLEFDCASLCDKIQIQYKYLINKILFDQIQFLKLCKTTFPMIKLNAIKRWTNQELVSNLHPYKFIYHRTVLFIEWYLCQK